MDASITTRQPLDAVREIASGVLRVPADEQRRIMLMAQGEAMAGHSACEECHHLRHCSQRHPYGEGVATEYYTECSHTGEPMDCPAVAGAWADGLCEVTV